MTGICEGRIVVVTGAGRGLGREYALEFARQGAKVVVNDLGTSNHGEGVDTSPADDVVTEIKAMGGEAIASYGDVADFKTAGQIIKAAIDTFGGLDVLVNNAGFVRDRMFVSTSEEEWDAVIRVHLKGHFAMASNACAYWRNEVKQGNKINARIINTSSGAGLQGSVGQSSYSAAKGGIATLTLVQAAELGRYGITSNALAPAARTRMTEEVFADDMAKPDEGFDENDPANVAPLVAWLGSEQSEDVSGCIFEVKGGMIGLADGYRMGALVDIGARWDPADVGGAVAKIIAEQPAPQKTYGT